MAAIAAVLHACASNQKPPSLSQDDGDRVDFCGGSAIVHGQYGKVNASERLNCLH